MKRLGAVGDVDARDRSDAIADELKDDWEKREPCVLLLGTRDSGKKTFMKQVRIMGQGGISSRERMKYKAMIQTNLLASARSLVVYAQRVGIRCSTLEFGEAAERILHQEDQHPGTDDAQPILSLDAARAILQLCADPVIQQIIVRRSGLAQPCLMNFAPYFFSEALRIGLPRYVPSDADILRVKGLASNCPSVIQTRLKAHSQSLRLITIEDHRLVDKKKWTNYFDNVNGIIFCTAISDYTREGPSSATQRKQMAEAMSIFESILTSPLFRRVPIILFLNKIDLFVSMLPHEPLEKYFPKYKGGSSVSKATQYIAKEFLKPRQKGQFVYPYITEATDTTRTRSTLTRVTGRILDTPLVTHWSLL